MAQKQFKPTKTWAKKNLVAVRKLIKHYEGERAKEGTTDRDFDTVNQVCREYLGDPVEYCPLCVSTYGSRGESDCKRCPWIVFKNMHCSTSGYQQSLKANLSRLRGWERRLTNMIEKFKEGRKRQ